jgi:ABC-type branched-subunit amino acid transport system ATPase component
VLEVIVFFHPMQAVREQFGGMIARNSACKTERNGMDKTLLPPNRYGELAVTTIAGGNLQLSTGSVFCRKAACWTSATASPYGRRIISG